jgi:hypothetical protein
MTTAGADRLLTAHHAINPAWPLQQPNNQALINQLNGLYNTSNHQYVASWSTRSIRSKQASQSCPVAIASAVKAFASQSANPSACG